MSAATLACRMCEGISGAVLSRRTIQFLVAMLRFHKIVVSTHDKGAV